MKLKEQYTLHTEATDDDLNTFRERLKRHIGNDRSGNRFQRDQMAIQKLQLRSEALPDEDEYSLRVNVIGFNNESQLNEIQDPKNNSILQTSDLPRSSQS